MKLSEMTVAQLLEKFPDGFSVGPGGQISKIILASSQLTKIARAYPVAMGRQGYLVVDMIEEEDEKNQR